MIDVIVPVYKGVEETRACLESVWGCMQTVDWRLVVINDCSPEPALTDWLRAQSGQRPMILLENEQNLGFVASVNRGMGMSVCHDVVLLNSDTEVHGNWLDRLLEVAETDSRVATVTPFSNNATICSYPAFCQDNALPAGWDLARLDTLFAQCNSVQGIEIPTAVGFCMFVRRTALQQVGLFDVETFGKGYGEENDFCCKATALGMRHVLAPNVFVWHKGNVSFGDGHNELKKAALEKLNARHPSYIGRVQAHLMADPAREARLAVDIARWRASLLCRTLFITHDRGGGTEQHCRELTNTLGDQARVFRLAPEPGGQVALSAYSQGEAARMHFWLPQQYAALLKLLRQIGIDHIHIHHTMAIDHCVFDLAKDLNLAYDYTFHDYHAYCPQVSLTGSDNRYCNEQGLSQCEACLTQRSAAGVTIRQWRGNFKPIVCGAQHVIVPSASVGERVRRMFDATQVVVVDHPDALNGWERRVRSPRAQGRDLRVAVLGALSPVKGPDLLEAAGLDAQKRGLAVTFKLFGYAYRDLQQHEKLQVHGPYSLTDIQRLLTDWGTDLIWLPAQWPETYSYTLSHALQGGWPVLVSNLGAPADRVQGRPYSWVYRWDAPASEWNDRLLDIAATAPADPAIWDAPPTSAQFYRDTYAPVGLTLRHIPLPPGQAPSEAELRETRAHPLSWVQRWRLKLLTALVRLRAHPALAKLAQRIPMSTQQRLKNRLLGNARAISKTPS